MRKILTIDVGGTFIKYAVVTGIRSFKIAGKNKIPTPRTDHATFIEKLAEIFHTSDTEAEGIAISMPGLIDTARGVCISSGALDFSNGHCITEELQQICNVPVTVENDANCAALAELRSGSLTGLKDAVVLVFGTAVGGAIIRNKELYRGVHFCAGEVSYTLKSMDADFSEENLYGLNIGALAFQKTCAKILNMPEDEVTGEMIFQLIEENDDDILDALYKFAHGVAVKIFNLQMILDPERFALGGGISEQQSFIDAVQDQLDELCAKAPDFLPRPEIVACKYHNDANLLGALYRYLKG